MSILDSGENHVHPLVMAHQGASGEAPSNTLVAFDKAVKLGADVLETDIHWTKDGVIVVSHDETVDAMSDGSGPIREMTLRELRKLDFGYRFSLDRGSTFPFRGRGIRIPTLSEVLLRYPNQRINIDIKPKYGAHIGGLIKELESHDALSRTIVASFHHNVLAEVRARYSPIQTSASPQEVSRFLAASYFPVFQREWRFVALQVPLSRHGIPIVTERFLALAKRNRVLVHVWTIDDVETMRRLYRLGVDGIVTNYPDRAVTVRSELIDQSLK